MTTDRRTVKEVMDLLASDAPLNLARRVFSAEAARIEQASARRTGLWPIEMRRMEFEAVEKIIAVYNGGQKS